MTVYFKTDTGRVRSSNQDAAASGLFDGGCWGVVCDGMGGASGGDIASSRAVEIIGGQLESRLVSGMDAEQTGQIVQEAVSMANAEIYEMSQNDLSLRGMGTTVVCAVVFGGSAFVFHAGDSRAYLLGGRSIKCVTKDHSMVQELVDIGRLTPEQARTHPRKNIITRAIGVGQSVKVDQCRLALKEGQMLLLCSDGLTNCVEDGRLLEMAGAFPAEELCAAYIDEANGNGGADNITALIIAK